MTASLIRLGVPSDAAPVSHLISSTWSKFFGYSVSPSDLATYLSTSLSVPQIEADLSNPEYTFLICTSASSEILGVVQLVRGTSEDCLTLIKPLELRRLYLDSTQHGSGLAANLIKSAEDYARGNGYGSLWLGVWEDNARGKRFYEKMGFGTCGEHWFYVGESKRRDWVMQKAL